MQKGNFVTSFYKAAIILFPTCTSLHKKMKFSIKDFLSKCDQIRRKVRIRSHLLKKSLMENFFFSTVLGLFVCLYWAT